MPILLNPETEKLLEERMKRGGYSSADEIVRAALETLDHSEAEMIEDLDPKTQAAIIRAEAQADRGEGRPWNLVKAELQARFAKK
jgi:Arc/MetJ-type ribon-helix-helix transcriptional regulator